MGVSVSLDYVGHKFGKGASVLTDLDFKIETGESIALVGESGCGKSTLLHIIAGFIRPTNGCIRIGGKAITKPNSNWNMMFQKPALFPWLSVKKNVGLGLEFNKSNGLSKKQINDRSMELLQLVGLRDKADDSVEDLSGGQQQRVALARSLAVDPDLILLDEPFSALDAFTRRNLQNEVLSIVKERKITLVLVTHDIDEALMMGDKVVVMSRNPGRLKDVINVNLTYPRNPIQPEFSQLREKLMQSFKESISGSSTASDKTSPTSSHSNKNSKPTQPEDHSNAKSLR